MDMSDAGRFGAGGFEAGARGRSAARPVSLTQRDFCRAAAEQRERHSTNGVRVPVKRNKRELAEPSECSRNEAIEDIMKGLDLGGYRQPKRYLQESPYAGYAAPAPMGYDTPVRVRGYGAAREGHDAYDWTPRHGGGGGGGGGGMDNAPQGGMDRLFLRDRDGCEIPAQQVARTTSHQQPLDDDVRVHELAEASAAAHRYYSRDRGGL
ncbi:hypothetical protein T484DRAFT_1756988 [Baffinella frigidus]|nr:hypothetical protein T484DRAFT_1756988 [Cryptophyta sp. CCMP2293]